MLTGRRAFEGEDVSLTLSAVLQRDPEWVLLPGNVPHGLNTYLRRCLQKEPKQRVQSIGDMRLAIGGAFDDARGDERMFGTGVARRRALPWVAGMLLGAVMSGLAVWNLTRPDPTVSRPVRFTVSTDDGVPVFVTGLSQDVAISPDGEHVAFLTGRGTVGEQLHVRSLGQLTSETIVTDRLVASPFFSPDGGSVGFASRGQPRVLTRVGVGGGAPAAICDLDGLLLGASWGADGNIIFASNAPESGLWRVAAAGGEPEVLTTPDRAGGEVDHVWPELLPGGETVLFTIQRDPAQESQIVALSVKTLEQTVVHQGGSYPRYSPTGHLLYVSEGDLWAIAFDADRLETGGAPVRMQEDVLIKPSGGAALGLSEHGSLIYLSAGAAVPEERTMVWVDQQGEEEPLSAPPAPYESPRISPDGRRIAVEVRDPENNHVIIYDLERHTSTRLTQDPGRDRYPLWSLDGQRVVFSSDRRGAFNLFSKSADGTGPVERLTTSDSLQWADSWSADGRTLVVMENTPGGTEPDLRVLSLDAGGETEDLVASEQAEYLAAVSPDGRWIAYTSTEAGPGQIHVRPFPNVTDGLRVVVAPGGSPVWAPDGRKLFFRQNARATRDMMVVDVDTGAIFSSETPEHVFAAPYFVARLMTSRPWDLADDGRFLMVKPGAPGRETGAAHITVVLNWDQELLERVPIP